LKENLFIKFYENSTEILQTTAVNPQTVRNPKFSHIFDAAQKLGSKMWERFLKWLPKDLFEKICFAGISFRPLRSSAELQT
jgi:hypothetical protein